VSALDPLVGRRVAVWGAGGEGRALGRALLGSGTDVVFVDDDPEGARRRLAGDGAPSIEVRAPSARVLGAVDVIVRSPGVCRYREELRRAEAAGVTVTTMMALWLADNAGRPVIAVTGTKGKSTTSALTAAVLRALGVRVALAGNIGVPVTDLELEGPAEATVVEVSSFQAVDVTTSPPVGVLTALAPDHVDWHGSVEQYYRDKLNLFRHGEKTVVAVNAASPVALAQAVALARWVPYGADDGAVGFRHGWVTVDGERLVPGAALPLAGRYNIDNLLGALRATQLLVGAVPSPGALRRELEGFTGLPSRCRRVGEQGGVEFFDDALGSNPLAVGAVVDSFAGRPLTLVMGGADRGLSYAPVADALWGARPEPRVVLLPGNDAPIAAALEAAAPRGRRASVSQATSMGDAVRLAARATPDGGAVVFCPGAPTPGAEGTYRDRSRAFIEAVGLLPGGPPPAG